MHVLSEQHPYSEPNLGLTNGTSTSAPTLRPKIHTSSVVAFRKRPRYRDSVGIRCAASFRKGTRGRIRLRGETSLASSARNVDDAGDGAEIMANSAFSACPKE